MQLNQSVSHSVKHGCPRTRPQALVHTFATCTGVHSCAQVQCAACNALRGSAQAASSPCPFVPRFLFGCRCRARAWACLHCTAVRQLVAQSGVVWCGGRRGVYNRCNVLPCGACVAALLPLPPLPALSRAHSCQLVVSVAGSTQPGTPSPSCLWGDDWCCTARAPRHTCTALLRRGNACVRLSWCPAPIPSRPIATTHVWAAVVTHVSASYQPHPPCACCPCSTLYTARVPVRVL